MNKAKLNELKKYLHQPIAYYVVLSRVSGGLTAGVFLSQLLYWSDKGKDPNGWIYKTQAEWEQETGLTRRNQETARKRLRERGIIEEKLAGIPARLHYRINDRLFELVVEEVSQLEVDSLGCTKSPSENGGNGQTVTEETVTHAETSRENKESTAASTTSSVKRSPTDERMCPIHDVPMKRREKGGDVWYSHRLSDGKWCKGDIQSEERGYVPEEDDPDYMPRFH